MKTKTQNNSNYLGKLSLTISSKLKKTSKIILGLICIASLISSCKKDSAEEVIPEENNSTGNPSGFTPPTSGYYKIDNTSNTPSMDASYINIAGNNCYITKQFDAIGITTSTLNIDFDAGENIFNQIAEGSFMAFQIDTISSNTATPQVQIALQTAGGTYFYKCRSGKIYVSKSGGKLRMTSDGTLNLSGYKYLENIVQYTRTCSFSLANLEQF